VLFNYIPHDLQQPLRKFAYVSMVLLSCTFVAAALYSLAQKSPSIYEAQASVLASTHTVGISDLVASASTSALVDANAYEAAARSTSLVTKALNQVTQTANETDVITLKNQSTITSEQSANSSLITLAVQDKSADLAAKKANALAKALVDWDKQRASEQLERIVTSFEKQIEALDQHVLSLQSSGATQLEIDGQVVLRAQQSQQLHYAQTLLSAASGRLEILEQALTPESPLAKHANRNAALGFATMLFVHLLGLAALQLRKAQRHSFTKLSQVNALDVIAELPQYAFTSSKLDARSTESIGSKLLFSTYETAKRVFLISSAKEDEGKSVIARNVAEYFASQNYKTLLIDANFRKPSLAKSYKLKHEESTNLQSLLNNPKLPTRAAKIRIDRPNDVVYLDLIANYTALQSPSELINQNLNERLKEWQQNYDIIILDSAPLLPVSDTLALAPFCTGTLLVSSVKHGGSATLSSAVDFLKRMGIRMLGIVVTNTKSNKQTPQGKHNAAFEKQNKSLSETTSLEPLARAVK